MRDGSEGCMKSTGSISKNIVIFPLKIDGKVSKIPPGRVPEAPELREMRPSGSRAGQRGLPRVPRGVQK